MGLSDRGDQRPLKTKSVTRTKAQSVTSESGLSVCLGSVRGGDWGTA